MVTEQGARKVCYTSLYQTELPHRAKLVYIYFHDRQDKKCKAWPALKP